MLTGRLGAYVEPRELGARSGTLRGWIPLAEFTRLTSLLETDEGRVQVELEFAKDGEGRTIVRGTASVPVTVTCQRCLEPSELGLAASIDMVLVSSESEADQVVRRLDAVVVGTDKVKLVSLLEDDLILSLPNDACPTRGIDCPQRPEYEYPDPKAMRTQRPFGVLAKLKGNPS